MSDLTFLVPDLRRYLYDVVEPYTYTDDLLDSYLQQAIKMLGSKWNYRYAVDSAGTVARSSSITFNVGSPPVIEFADEAKIVLQASILIKSGSAFNSSWDVGSWKDDELAYSNIQGAKSRDSSIARDQDLLDQLLKGRLFAGKAYELPGFHLPYNTEEGTL